MNHKTDVQRKSFEKTFELRSSVISPLPNIIEIPPRRSLAFARFKTQKFFIDILEVNVLENYC